MYIWNNHNIHTQIHTMHSKIEQRKDLQFISRDPLQIIRLQVNSQRKEDESKNNYLIKYHWDSNTDVPIEKKINLSINCQKFIESHNCKKLYKIWSNNEIALTYGPMASGKSSTIRSAISWCIENSKKYLIICHNHTRGTDCTSRNGFSCKCVRSDSLYHLNISEYDVIIIDEVQFFGDICQFIKICKENNKKLFMFGLDKNIFNEWFGEMEQVSKLVDYKYKKQSVCECCGDPAEFTMIDDEEVYKNYVPGKEFVSTNGKYKPVCKKCHPMA